MRGRGRTGVGLETLGRVLGGDAALDGVATLRDRVLGEAELGEGSAGGDLREWRGSQREMK